MDGTAVERIVAATGLSPLIDDDALLRCLELCAEWHREAIEFGTKQYMEERRKRLGLVVKTGKRLLLLLAHSDFEQWISGMKNHFELCELCPPHAIMKLIELTEAELSTLSLPRVQEYADGYKRRSPFEWLVGVHLPKTYELAFALGPDASVSDPFLRFAKAVLREMKITRNRKPYSVNSILRAMREAESDHTRRLSAGEQESSLGLRLREFYLRRAARSKQDRISGWWRENVACT
jgi:hypothetical protein